MTENKLEKKPDELTKKEKKKATGCVWFILFIVLVIVVSICSRNKNEKNEYATSEDFQIYDRENNQSYIRYKIIVPAGLTKEKLMENIRGAYKKAKSELENQKRVNILVYVEGNTVYSIAAYTVDIEESEEKENLALLDDGYFVPDSSCVFLQKNTTAKIESESESEFVNLEIFNNRYLSNPNAEDLTKKIKSTVFIVDHACEILAGCKIARYKIRSIDSGNKKIEGWISGSHFEKQQKGHWCFKDN